MELYNIVFLLWGFTKYILLLTFFILVYFQSVIHKAGFRSLDDGEEVEFESIPSDKGVEATYVCGPSGAECRGSNRRPMSRKKFRKIR